MVATKESESDLRICSGRQESNTATFRASRLSSLLFSTSCHVGSCINHLGMYLALLMH